MYERGPATGNWPRLVLLILAGLCAGTAVLHGMHALIVLEVESALIALVLAAGSTLLSVTAGHRDQRGRAMRDGHPGRRSWRV